MKSFLDFTLASPMFSSQSFTFLEKIIVPVLIRFIFIVFYLTKNSVIIYFFRFCIMYNQLRRISNKNYRLYQSGCCYNILLVTEAWMGYTLDDTFLIDIL